MSTELAPGEAVVAELFRAETFAVNPNPTIDRYTMRRPWSPRRALGTAACATLDDDMAAV